MCEIDLPQHWEILPFDRCLKKVKSKKISSIPQKNYQESGDFPIIDQGATFIAGWIDSVESIIFDDLPVVIFGDHTRVFKYVDFPFAKGADGTKILYANDDVLDARFFYYALLNLKVPNKGYNRHYRYLREFSVVCPPLPEQRAIAHVLGAIQEAKAARQRELALERERKAALMDHLFSHGTKGEPRKQTEIGEIPESWGEVELEDYSELITKGSSPKWQGFDYCDEGIYFVRSQNVGLGRLELNEIAYLPEGFNKKEKKSILQKNDLLINLVGASIGRAAVADDIVEGGNVNQAVAIVRFKQGVEPFFVMTFLLTLEGQVQLHKQKKDVARANLSLQDIKNLLIPLPSISEQQEIAEILQACDAKIAALEQEAAQLDELFHAMLDELMTGKRSAVPLIDAEAPN